MGGALRRKDNGAHVLASADADVSQSALLSHLADREEFVRAGKLTTIVFVRDRSNKGQEVCGYIDYGHRLQTEDCRAYFSGARRFLPKPSDLSYYNWETQTCTCNSTTNFQVSTDREDGVVFKNKRDRKIINVDPKATPGDNTERIEVHDAGYAQVVIFDHITRRKL